jgi:hypothetical protein
VSPRYHCCIAIFVAQQQVWFPFLIITLHYEYPLGADTVRIDNFFSNMGGGNDDKSFPYFEGTNFRDGSNSSRQFCENSTVTK